MVRYIAVDSGKYATKIATYDEENQVVVKSKFRTKVSEGYMDDDEIEAGTCLVEIDGKCYKVGNGAIQEAELETTKQTDIHRICTLTAIAKYISADEEDLVHVAFGLPILEYEDRNKKVAYRDFILPALARNEEACKATGKTSYFPSDTITIKYRDGSDGEPITKKFKIASKVVYPESSGVLYLDAVRFSKGQTAVIDIGNLNINGTCWNGFEHDKKYSLCCELGGNTLISGLSGKLSTMFGRFDETQTAKLLRKNPDDRKLVPVRTTEDNKDTPEKSKKVIDEYLLNYVRDIKQRCSGKQWSLDFMQLTFIGGTSDLIRNELRQVFGDVYIPENPEYANVVGFLKLMYTKRANKKMVEADKKSVEADASTSASSAAKAS